MNRPANHLFMDRCPNAQGTRRRSYRCGTRSNSPLWSASNRLHLLFSLSLSFSLLDLVNYSDHSSVKP